MRERDIDSAVCITVDGGERLRRTAAARRRYRELAGTAGAAVPTVYEPAAFQPSTRLAVSDTFRYMVFAPLNDELNAMFRFSVIVAPAKDRLLAALFTVHCEFARLPEPTATGPIHVSARLSRKRRVLVARWYSTSQPFTARRFE